MADVSGIENQLNDIFGKQAPKMPDGGKKFFVQWLPVLTLIGAVLSVFSAFALWNAAHTVSQLADFANELSRTYGGNTVSTSSMTFWVWIALAFTLVSAVAYFMAYNPLKAHEKKGWNYLFYVSLLSVAYSVVSIFINGRGFGSFLMGMLGAAIGWWILFQIRPSYTSGGHADHK
jgi:uncharacterized BrkB/YihY/UPF0761 family membrane protein